MGLFVPRVLTLHSIQTGLGGIPQRSFLEPTSCTAAVEAVPATMCNGEFKRRTNNRFKYPYPRAGINSPCPYRPSHIRKNEINYPQKNLKSRKKLDDVCSRRLTQVLLICNCPHPDIHNQTKIRSNSDMHDTHAGTDQAMLSARGPASNHQKHQYTFSQSDRRHVIKIIVLLAGVLLFTLLVIGWIPVRVVKPISKLRDILHDIAEGEGDLSQCASVKHQNELVQVLTHFKASETIGEININVTRSIASKSSFSSQPRLPIYRHLCEHG